MGNATDTMTRFLTSFLRIGVAMIVLVGLSAGTALAQPDQYVDPVDGSSGAGGSASNPALTIGGAISNASPGATIALRTGQSYNEDLDLTSAFTFTSWNGESGTDEETGADAPGAAVLNGNLTVGAPGTNTPETLTLAEGLSLEFEQNEVLTLVGEDASALNPGSIVGGQGELLISTASGEFTINITRDDGTSQVRGTIQNLTVDKPNGVVDVVRAESSADPTLTAELGIWDGDGAVSPNGFADLDIQAGEVTANRNNVRFVANTGTDASPADPAPSLNVSDGAALGSNGSLVLQVTGELGFETTGDGELDILLEQISAPVNTGNGDGPAGTTISFSSIGNGGTSVVSEDTLSAPSLTDINGTLTVENTDTFVEAGALENVSSDLRVETNASAVAGGSNELTVGDGVSVQNDSRLEFASSVVVEGPTTVTDGGLGSSTLLLNDAGTFNGSFDIDGGSIATFNFITEFNGAVGVSDATMTFATPGGGAEGLSNVNGALTANSGQINLNDGTDSDPDEGLHNLALNGDITIEDSGGDPVTNFNLVSDGDDEPTRVFLAGTEGSQDFEIADGAGIDFDRLTVQNDVELVDASNGTLTIGGDPTVDGDLFLEDGTFNTNGQLNADGITLTRNRTADNDGELFRGAGDIAYTETSGSPDTPSRIVYTGTQNIPTADELLPEGRDDSDQGEPSDLEISELAVDMDDSDAVVTLNADHTVTSSTEILSGNLSLGSATLALANNSTFVRGDGTLDPGPVSPEDALLFPEVDDVGSDGISLEYVNDEDPVTTGIEFPSNDRNADLILDVAINSSETGNPNAGVSLAQEGTFRINQNLNLNNGTLDINGQTLQHNGGGSVNYNHEAELADTGDEGLFQFIGDDTDATVAGNTDDESGTIFPFPTTEVAKDDSSTVTFNVTDNNDSPMEDPNDGYAFNGDFTIAAAQNFDGTGDGDGIDQPNDGVTFVDGDNGTDVLSIDGNFAQNAGSFYAGGVSNKFASFEVTGNLTKAASDTSRFEVDFGPAPQAFAVDGNVTQESGTFLVEGASTFTVGGDLQNNSPDALDFDNFDSDAFEVSTPATFSVGGTLSQSAGNFEVTGSSSSSEASLSISENYEQDGGTATIAGFSGSDASVSIGDSYTQEGGTAEIPDATLVEVTNDVTVTAGDLFANLQDNFSTPPNQFVASTLTVGDSTTAGDGDADFSAGRDAGFRAADGTAISTDNDLVSIDGETSVRYDGQLSLAGAELQQGGNFTLLGAGDRLQENVTDNTTAGLVGTVRFVGSETQTVETDETPDTYFHGFAVNTEDEADVELASNVSTNTAPPEGIGSESPLSSLRPFGTVFLERGDIVTGEDTLKVLAPQPTDGGDLTQAINADEVGPNGAPVPSSPVLGGTRNSHVVGTLQRAIQERRGSTGGFVSDGYIYPLGDGEQYSALVLDLPTDLGRTQFFTVTTAEDPGVNLPDGLTSEAINPNTGQQFDLDLNAQSAPYFRVDFDEAPDEDFNVRAISGGLSGSVSAIKQMRLAQFDEEAGTAQEAGIYDFSGDPNDDLGFGPNSFISGVPNVIHEGVDLTQGNVIGFASDTEFNPAIQSDADVLALEGQVTYPTVENGSLVDGQGLEGVEVEASSSDTTATATTDGSGSFIIAGLPAGDYDVEATVSDSVENVQTADALRAVRGFAGIDAFAGPFQEQVADVNGSGNVNATDALLIAQFVLGNVDGFDVGAFVTESESVTLENGSSTDVTLFAAEAGDVRLNGGETGSSEAALASSTISPKTSTGAVATQSSSQSSSVDAEAGKTFEVPVRIDRSTTVGAYQMAFDFPSEKASFEGIKGTAQDVLTNASDGTVKVSWFDQSGESALDLQSGSELVTLRFKAADDVDGVEFAPEVTSGEIAGADATPLSAGVEIQAVRIGAPAPDKFALNGSYPNPVRSQATLNMDLPSRTDVTVEVYNVLGQRVQTMERTMSAGAGQTIKLDGSKFASGQYFYRVKANFEGETAQETGRITVVK